MKHAVRAVATKNQIELVLIVSSKGIYDNIATLHEGMDFCLKTTVQRIRDSFQRGDIKTLRSFQGMDIIADALKKMISDMHRVLKRVATSRMLCIPENVWFELRSAS